MHDNYMANYRFKMMYCGYDCIVINSNWTYEQFEPFLLGYDIGISCIYNGNIWVIKFYSEDLDLLAGLFDDETCPAHLKGVEFTSDVPIWEMEGAIR